MAMSHHEQSVVSVKKTRLTTAEFIARARSVHGDKYDYSRVVYTRSADPIEVLCPEHGPFFPRANNHVNLKSECPACKGCAPTTLEVFLKRSKESHGDTYDYSRVIYLGVQKKVEIICPQHGPFWQIPMDHQKGRGCAICGISKASNKTRLTQQEFISRARLVHGDKYDYSKAEYLNSQSPITIICPEHGEFSQIANYHLNGNGCIQCAGTAVVTREEFIHRSSEAHLGKYTYGAFLGLRRKVEIICPEHGLFLQIGRDHINGHGCPQCASERSSSEHEIEVAEWLLQQGIETIRNDRTVLEGLELDIYSPTHRIAIEFNGAFWHTDTKLTHARIHEHKANVAEKAGIRLITIWDFDWLRHRPLVERMLRNAFNLSEAPAVYARKCTVLTVPPVKANRFYDEHHIQKSVYAASVHLGLYYEGELQACMSFGKSGSRRLPGETSSWELVRFAAAGRVPGAASRLFTHFQRSHNPSIVWSFSDRQHFTGSVYPLLGFIEDGRLKADYRVAHQPPLGRIWHKSAWQRKNIPDRLKELGLDLSFDPTLDPRTEKEMEALAKVHRIMDSGKVRWKWTKQSPDKGAL